MKYKKVNGFDITYNDKVKNKLAIVVYLIWVKKDINDFPQLFGIATDDENYNNIKIVAEKLGFAYIFREERETNHELGASAIQRAWQYL